MNQVNGISVYGANYNDFMKAKEEYLKDSSEDSYLAMLLAFSAFDVDLKTLLNSGTITAQSYRHIKEKAQEGLH